MSKPVRRDLALAAASTLLVVPWVAQMGDVIANEPLYLLAAWKWWRPEFLASDWTFAVPWREHTLFNAGAGLLSLALPLDTLKWVLRIAGWFAVFGSLFPLLRRLSIPWWVGGLGILCWLRVDQAFFGGEWIVGGAEAKVPAYAALFSAVSAFLDRRYLAGGLLLGLCFSFHPAVGVGAGAGLAAALLVDGVPWRSMATAAAAVVPPAVPGVISSLGLSRDSGAAGAWELLVTARLPHHLDPLAFGRSGHLKVAIFLCLLALLVARWRASREVRFLAGFLAGTGLLYAFGIAARVAEAWSLLQIYPFRLLPLFLPLFVPALLATQLIRHWADGRVRRELAAALAICLAVLFYDPDWARPIDVARAAAEAAEDRERAAAAAWVASHAPAEAVILVSPNYKRTFWDFRRGLVVSWLMPRYERFPEWRARMEALAGPIESRVRGQSARFDARFHAIPADSIVALGAKYGAELLVSRGHYPFPVRHRAGTLTIYSIPVVASLSSPPAAP